MYNNIVTINLIKMSLLKVDNFYQFYDIYPTDFR